jgi:AraC-like DNA-binding protein
MQREAAFAQPDLKVADLARIAGEAEYKITQCVTGALGFRNFNHMANHFRVAEAKRRLADRRLDHLPILTIALDCGFGSIGPFNRAFKAEAGTTPMHFRKTCQADDCQPTR